MRVKHLFCLALISLPLFTVNVFATDSTYAAKPIVPVGIGPQELDPIDLLDPLVVRNMKIDAALKAKSNEANTVRNIERSASLNSLLSENEISNAVDLELELQRFKAAGNIQGQALIRVSYGVYYGQKAEYARAIESFNEALRLKELAKDKRGMAKILQNLAALYQAAGAYEKALACNDSFIALNTSMGRLADVGFGYLQRSEILALQKRFAQAEDYLLKKCLPLFRRTANKTGRMSTFQHLGSIYTQQKRLPEAKWFYLQANIMADILHNRSARIENLVSLAAVKYALGETKLAIADYKEAEALAKQQNYLSKLVRIKGELSEIYRDMGNYADAGLEIAEYARLSSNLFKSSNL